MKTVTTETIHRCEFQNDSYLDLLDDIKDHLEGLDEKPGIWDKIDIKVHGTYDWYSAQLCYTKKTTPFGYKVKNNNFMGVDRWYVERDGEKVSSYYQNEHDAKVMLEALQGEEQ